MNSFQKIATYTLFILGMLISINASAQRAQKQPKLIKTEFTVEGVCTMCKKRIESAVDISGVKVAQWNKQTKMLTVIYQPKKVSEQELHIALIHAGHSTEYATAEAEVYQELPFCCQYNDGVETH